MAVRNNAKPGDKSGNFSTVAEEVGKHAYYLISLVVKDLSEEDVEIIGRKGNVDAVEARLVAERVTERLANLVATGHSVKDSIKDYEGIGTLPGCQVNKEHSELAEVITLMKALTGSDLFKDLLTKLKEESTTIKAVLQGEQLSSKVSGLFAQLKESGGVKPEVVVSDDTGCVARKPKAVSWLSSIVPQ